MLFVESYEIPAAAKPGYGYLEVVVPASADAPHQVEGIYYGRSDTGKCRLSDQQVERLMREREQQRHGTEDALRALIAADRTKGSPGSIRTCSSSRAPALGASRCSAAQSARTRTGNR